MDADRQRRCDPQGARRLRWSWPLCGVGCQVEWRASDCSGVRQERGVLRDLGADGFIDYAKALPEDVVRDVDLVIDSVGGPATGRFLRTLKHGGALFPIFPLGFSGTEKLGITVSATQVRSSGAQLKEVGRLLNDGTIRVAIDSTFALTDARKAHERAAPGHIQGKIVLNVE
jgi:NADPH:quinone reductase-like Zn-dependent oxidoreductase